MKFTIKIYFLVICLGLASLPALAGVKVKQAYWFVELSCDGNSKCYAASNASYTGSLNAARKFRDYSDAQAFFESLTTSLQDKSPRIVEGDEFKCVNDPELKGPSC